MSSDPEQPTLDTLNAAWTTAIQCESIPGAGTETLLTLKTLRYKKTTWVGSEENAVRFAIDNYLREKLA